MINIGNVKNNISLTYEESHKEIDGELYKLCVTHKKFFQNEEEWILCNDEYFYKNKGSSDGLFPYCKRCNIQKSIIWKKKNPEKLKISQYKYDHSERKSKALQENSKKQRAIGYQKQWQQNNKDKIKQYQENRKQHGEHMINKYEWEDCKEYFDNCCAYCGLPIEEHFNKFKGKMRLTDFHREHVEHNGVNDLSNCIPSCKSCNTSKHQFNMEEWYSKQNFFSQEKLDKIHKWINEDYKLYILEHKPKNKYTKKSLNNVIDTNKLDFNT